ncbi:hypothetical protein PFISCL1PPCAC_26220 [Pristionchus fissidentatus]|uniref:Secreted protein n=1 Tax=Pristionchus fissidentatus TaxID=1538716 RepID=A0AAV5WUC4_9BILA|nr:hypothetical protein PFISCL1PPCAC_26220 [Pristionchus fissidentatus]
MKLLLLLLGCASLTAGQFDLRYFTESQATTIKRCFDLAVDWLTDSHQSERMKMQIAPELSICYDMLRATFETTMDIYSTKGNVSDIANLFSHCAEDVVYALADKTDVVPDRSQDCKGEFRNMLLIGGKGSRKVNHRYGK